MNILLTNDDSISSPGIKVLARHLSASHTVVVAAPKHEMSGISHSFTIFSPLFFEEVEVIPGLKGYSIQGTPSDCVKIGVKKIARTRPDLIISGFNNGENSGISSFYSGTVAGAREGVFFGIKSLSLSLCRNTEAHFNYALGWLDRCLGKIADKTLEFNASLTYLNVNFPACDPAGIKGTRFARQGIAPFNDDYEERVNPSGQKYYWLFGTKHASACDADDERALCDHFVAVTPLSIDMTDHAFLDKYAKNPNLF